MSRANPRFRRTNLPLPAATPNTVELIVGGSIENQLTINTFYYIDNGATMSSTYESGFVAAWRALAEASYAASCSNDYAITFYKAQVLTAPARIPYILTLATTIPGTGGAGHFPTETAAYFIRRTLFKGQSGRGRFSLPALPLTFATASRLNAAGVTALNNFGTNAAANVVAGAITWSAALVSRRGKTPNIQYGAAVLQSITLSVLLGTIRRRRIGRGK